MNFDELATEKVIHLHDKDSRDEDLDVIVDVLRRSKVLEELNLYRNQLAFADGKFINALANNNTLKILYLGWNKIGTRGAKRLADALKSNRTLKKLYLAGNELGDKGAKHIAGALMDNKSLEEISLSENKIGVEGAKSLAEALKVNKTLKKLFLMRNKIGDNGAKHLADALMENKSLEEISLSNNKIGNDGANSLAACFMANQCIHEVSLWGNNITDIGAQKLIEALKRNDGIKQIHMGGNPISEHVEAEIEDLLKDPKREVSRSQMKHAREVIERKDEVIKHAREEVATVKTALAEQEKQIATLKTALATEERMRNAAHKDSHRSDDDTISKHGVHAVPETKKRRKRGTKNTENKIEMDGELVQKIMNDIVASGEQVKFHDIAGLEVAKRIVSESITCPMLRPDLFTGLRACPKGLLLFGPPGTGKTLIGKAIACESGATFFSVSSSSLTSKWEGDGEKLVRTMFDVAYDRAPSVIFMDEVDSLLTQRKSDESEASRRIKTEFLVQLDGAGNTRKGHVLFIGATNRPQELDEGIRRRFEKRIYIPLPKQQAREALLRNLLAKNSNSLSDGQMKSLSRDADGFSGADLSNLCKDAALGPLRDLGYEKAMSMAAEDLPPISYDHFQHSLSASNRSVAEEELVVYEEWNKLYGSS